MPVVLLAERRTELLGAGFYDREVDTAILPLWGRQTEERNRRVEQRIVVGGGPEPVRSIRTSVRGNEFWELLLVDRWPAGVDVCDNVLVDVDIHHLVAVVGKTGGDGGVDVANDGDFTGGVSSVGYIRIWASRCNTVDARVRLST